MALITTKKNKVIVVEMADSVAPGVWHQHPNDILPRLAEKSTMFYLSKKLVSIDDEGIAVEDTKTKRISKLDADAVVLAMGVKSDKSLYDEIKDMANVYAIGDADKVGRIADATMSAFKCVKNIK